MKKKSVSMLMCLSMVSTLLAGCGKNPAAVPSTSANTESSAASESSEASESPAASETSTEAEKDQSSQKPYDGTEISVLVPVYGDPGEELLKEFEEKTGISVIMNAVAWDQIHDKIVTAAAGKTAAADVMEVGSVWVGEFNSAGWLEPVELSDEDVSDIGPISAFTVDEKIVAVPWCNDYRLAFHNKAHFTEAKIEKAPETWDEVYEACKAIKAAGICEYPFAVPLGAEEATTTTLLWMAYTKNGNVFHDDNTLDEAACKDALAFLDKMFDEGLIDPALVNGTGLDAYNKILSGEASYIVGPTKYVQKIANPEECKCVGDIEPILVPGTDGPAKFTNPFPEALGINAYSENKEAALEFVKWYTSIDVQKELFAVNGIIPTRTSGISSLIDDGAITYPGQMLEQAERVKTPWPNGIPAYYSEYSNGIYNNMNAMYRGEMDAEAAFTAILEHTNSVVQNNKQFLEFHSMKIAEQIFSAIFTFQKDRKL